MNLILGLIHIMCRHHDQVTHHIDDENKSTLSSSLHVSSHSVENVLATHQPADGNNPSDMPSETGIRTDILPQPRRQITIRSRLKMPDSDSFNDDEKEFEDDIDAEDAATIPLPFDDGHALSLNATSMNKRGKDTISVNEYQDSYLPLIKSVDDAPSIYSDPYLLNTILKFRCTFVVATDHRNFVLTPCSCCMFSDAHFLITTVDGKFSVLSAEHGQKRMGLDSSDQPLYQSLVECGSGYQKQVIPDINGHLYVLQRDEENEEYLEALPFTVDDVAHFSGYADRSDTHYSVDTKSTTVWIDSDEWQVCKPPADIPDITDCAAVHSKEDGISEDEDTENDWLMECGRHLVLVTRVDREINAVDIGNPGSRATSWRLKHGEYRVPRENKQTVLGSSSTRFQLYQSLEDYSLFLYDRQRGQIKWSKSLSSIISNVKLLSNQQDVFRFHVHHTVSRAVEGGEERMAAGLVVVPISKENHTQIAVHHSMRNPIVSHMYLPAISGNHETRHTLNLESDFFYDAIKENANDDEEDSDGLSIVDEAVDDDSKQQIPSSPVMGPQNEYQRTIRVVPLLFEHGVDDQDDVVMPSPIPSGGDYREWLADALKQLGQQQEEVMVDLLRRFQYHEYPQMIDAQRHPHPFSEPHSVSRSSRIGLIEDDDSYKSPLVWYHEKEGVIAMSCIFLVFLLYLGPWHRSLRRLWSSDDGEERDEERRKRERDRACNIKRDAECHLKMVGKLKYNVRMKLGAGQRGHVFCGWFEDRRVAIKRIDRMVSDERAGKVENEINLLLKVDHNPNIVRYYANECDDEFMYIALDLCLCSLYDVIKSRPSDVQEFRGRDVPQIAALSNPIISVNIAIRPLSADGRHPPFCSCNDCRLLQRAQSRKLRPDRQPRIGEKFQNEQKRHLMNHGNWRRHWIDPKEEEKGNLPPKGLKLLLHRQLFVEDAVKRMCRQMMDGLIALHTANAGCIIHRDIKPQNILIARDHEDGDTLDDEPGSDRFRCKLADMGIAKLMDPSRMSFDTENCGTLFWNAPELVYWKSRCNLNRIMSPGMEHKAECILNPMISSNLNCGSQDFTLALGSIFGEMDSNSLKPVSHCSDSEDEESKDIEVVEDHLSELSLSQSVSRGSFECSNDNDNDDDDDEPEALEWFSSRLTPAVDIFSLGCVFSFILSKGSHPYGDNVVDQRENMERRRPNLEYLQQSVPAAFDLIWWMINVDPVARPKASECRLHPFFWSDTETLQFLLDTSDFIEKSDKSHALRVTMEMASHKILGPDWARFVDKEMLCDAGRHRKYSFGSMRDYLRLIRNKWTHFAELPATLQRKLGDCNSMKSGSRFLWYFTQCTPHLVMYCYKLIASAIGQGDSRLASFERYYGEISSQRVQAYKRETRVLRFRSWMDKW